jgi:hypothetical protein
MSTAPAPPQPHTVAAQRAFMTAAECHKSVLTLIALPFPRPTIPSIFLEAFALELYIKSILIERQTPFKHSHDLYDLYCKIESSIRDRIEKKYAELVATMNPQLVPLHEGKSVKTLAEVLSPIRNAFDDWRYIHEKTWTVSYHGGPAAEAFNLAITEMWPGWKPYIVTA